MEKKIEYFTIKGELVFSGTFNQESITKYDRSPKIRFSIKNPTFQSDDEVKRLFGCYDGASSFVPKFINEGLGEYFNFKTYYPVVVKDSYGNQMKDEEINPHAEVYAGFKCVITESSIGIYPTDLKVIKNGTKQESLTQSANW